MDQIIDTKDFVEKDLERVKDFYTSYGYVTRKEVRTMDALFFAMKALAYLKDIGFQEARAEGVQNYQFQDYSCIIYNTSLMDVEEAREYMRNHILRDFSKEKSNV